MEEVVSKWHAIGSSGKTNIDYYTKFSIKRWIFSDVNFMSIIGDESLDLYFDRSGLITTIEKIPDGASFQTVLDWTKNEGWWGRKTSLVRLSHSSYTGVENVWSVANFRFERGEAGEMVPYRDHQYATIWVSREYITVSIFRFVLMGMLLYPMIRELQYIYHEYFLVRDFLALQDFSGSSSRKTVYLFVSRYLMWRKLELAQAILNILFVCGLLYPLVFKWTRTYKTAFEAIAQRKISEIPLEFAPFDNIYSYMNLGAWAIGINSLTFMRKLYEFSEILSSYLRAAHEMVWLFPFWAILAVILLVPACAINNEILPPGIGWFEKIVTYSRSVVSSVEIVFGDVKEYFYLVHIGIQIIFYCILTPTSICFAIIAVRNNVSNADRILPEIFGKISFPNVSTFLDSDICIPQYLKNQYNRISSAYQTKDWQKVDSPLSESVSEESKNDEMKEDEKTPSTESDEQAVNRPDLKEQNAENIEAQSLPKRFSKMTPVFLVLLATACDLVSSGISQNDNNFQHLSHPSFHTIIHKEETYVAPDQLADDNPPISEDILSRAIASEDLQQIQGTYDVLSTLFESVFIDQVILRLVSKGLYRLNYPIYMTIETWQTEVKKHEAYFTKDILSLERDIGEPFEYPDDILSLIPSMNFIENKVKDGSIKVSISCPVFDFDYGNFEEKCELSRIRTDVRKILRSIIGFNTRKIKFKTEALNIYSSEPIAVEMTFDISSSGFTSSNFLVTTSNSSTRLNLKAIFSWLALGLYIALSILEIWWLEIRTWRKFLTHVVLSSLLVARLSIEASIAAQYSGLDSYDKGAYILELVTAIWLLTISGSYVFGIIPNYYLEPYIYAWKATNRVYDNSSLELSEFRALN
eukprot:GHVP01067043.1.p1 GENE.GHVP01067043.1~~GHVP01067043.1.p1  ORF type:complete len:866 (-),score=143.15 GHVP01067043.1:2874-5471(-)